MRCPACGWILHELRAGEAKSTLSATAIATWCQSISSRQNVMIRLHSTLGNRRAKEGPEGNPRPAGWRAAAVGNLDCTVQGGQGRVWITLTEVQAMRQALARKLLKHQRPMEAASTSWACKAILLMLRPKFMGTFSRCGVYPGLSSLPEPRSFQGGRKAWGLDCVCSRLAHALLLWPPAPATVASASFDHRR